MIFKTCTISHFEQNCRLLIDEETRSITIIDPGFDAETILAHCHLETYRIEQIILTHCHLDHGGAVADLLKLLPEKTPLYYHSKDQFLADHIEDTAIMYGLKGAYKNVPKPTTYLDDISSLSIGNHTVEIRFTPGHAPGHIVLYFEKGDHIIDESGRRLHINQPILIAGDTLFKGSIGRTDLPMGNHAQLIQSIKTQLLTLPDDTIVLPGHGPSTTILEERQYNPFLQ